MDSLCLYIESVQLRIKHYTNRSQKLITWTHRVLAVDTQQIRAHKIIYCPFRLLLMLDCITVFAFFVVAVVVPIGCTLNYRSTVPRTRLTPWFDSRILWRIFYKLECGGACLCACFFLDGIWSLHFYLAFWFCFRCLSPRILCLSVRVFQNFNTIFEFFLHTFQIALHICDVWYAWINAFVCSRSWLPRERKGDAHTPN